MVLESGKNLLCFAAFLFCISYIYSSKQYFNFERPRVYYCGKDFFSKCVFTSKLMTRKDPNHYVTVMFTSLKAIDESNMISMSAYELLSNVYKRTFVEMNFKICDVLEKDALILGDAFRSGYYRLPREKRVMSVLKCPIPPGTYNFPNMTFPARGVVDSFPFHEGRLFVNITAKGHNIARAAIDFVVRSMPALTDKTFTNKSYNE